MVSPQFRQTATQVQYIGVQGNVYSARDNHAGYIEARMDEIPDTSVLRRKPRLWP